MVDKEVLRQVVYQQKADMLLPEGTVKRAILEEILLWLKDSRIIILTGIRRSGKSTLLRQIMQNRKDCCYVNFEDERFIDFRAQDFEQLNEVLVEVYNNPKTYFFDEIQNVDKFETFVRRLQEHGIKVIMTGSNASLLSSELGTRLTGRYKSFEVYPFSFAEFLAFKKWPFGEGSFYLTSKKVELIKLFEDYCVNGGFPEYLKNKDRDYIRTVYENILYRDIIARHSIKRQKIIKELVNILTTNVSSQFTYNSIKKALGLANAITVKEYISYLNNSYLFFELQKFDFSIKKQLSSPKKIYLIDPVFNQISGLNFSPNKGRILENIAFIELKRRKKEAYYYNNAKKDECDFVIKDGMRVVEAIQVCHALNESNTEREINGALAAMDDFKLAKCLILTQEQEDEMRIKGKIITILPIWKWLLQGMMPALEDLG